MSASTIKGYRSALVDVHKKRHASFRKEFDAKLKDLLDGYDEIINDLKQKSLVKIREGKTFLKSNGYSMLAFKFMTLIPTRLNEAWSQVTFAWCYFVMMRNLISRSDSVETIMFPHMNWVEDCLTVEEQDHKGDQTGEEKFGKHIYANPFQPEICPILATAILIFCSPDGSEFRQKLFSGTNSKDRNHNLLWSMLRNLTSEELQVLGCNPNDIGSHSSRKGASSYCLGNIGGDVTIFSMKWYINLLYNIIMKYFYS